MQSSRSLALFLLGAAFMPLHPAFVQAGTSYATFVPTRPQISGLGGRTFTRCMDQSGGNTGGMLTCIYAEHGRLDLRLNASYRTTLGRLSQPKMMTLRSEERLWVATRDEACLVDLKDEREAGGTIYTVDFAMCRLEELKRRIVWVETQR